MYINAQSIVYYAYLHNIKGEYFMKYTKSALGLLNTRYRSVLRKCLLINLGLFALGAVAATPAMAADTWTGTITETGQFMDDLHTANPSWDRQDGVITGWGVDQILGKMNGAAAATDAVIDAVNDTATGLSATYTIATANQAAITTLNGTATTPGSVANSIATAIAGLDASESQTAGADGLALSITQVDGVITGISGSIASNTYDAYGAAAGVATTLLGTGAVDGSIAQALGGTTSSDTLTSVVTGIADTQAAAAVNALDTTVKQDASTTNPLALQVTQADGKITGVTGSITTASSIASTDNGVVTGAILAAQNYTTLDGVAGAISSTTTNDVQTAVDARVTAGVTAGIEALDSTASQTAGADGLALSITQVDGVITAISGSIAANTYDAYGEAATALATANANIDKAITYDSTTGLLTFKNSDGTTVDGVAYTQAKADTTFAALAGNNTFSGTNTFTNGISVTGGSLTTTGNATIGGTLGAGATTVASLTSTGNASVGGTLNAGATTVASLTSTGAVSGTTGTFSGAVSGTTGTFSGAISGASLSTTGNAVIGGTLQAGATTLTGDLQGTTATFTGLVNTNGLDAGAGAIQTTGTLSAGAATVTSLNAGSGTIQTTGALQGGTLAVTTDATVGGDFSVGGDATITGALSAGATTVASLNAGAGAIQTTGTLAAGASTLNSLTVTNNATVGGTLAVTGALSSNGLDAGSGAITTTGTLSAGAATVSSLDAGSGAITTTGAINGGTATITNQAQVGSLKIGTTSYGIGTDGAANVASLVSAGNITTTQEVGAGSLEVTGTSTLKGVVTMEQGFNFNSSDAAITAADTGASAITSGSATTLATTATVLKSAENASYTGTKVKGDESTSLTLKQAITNTTAALNNVLTTDGSEVDSAKVDVQWNSTDSTLATVLGNGAYSSTKNIAAGDSVTTALGKTDAAIGDRSAMTNGNNADYTTSLANKDIASAMTQVASNVGTAAQLSNAYNGVATTQSVNQNLNSLNATIGNINDLNAGTGSTGNAITNGTGTRPTTVVAALNNIDATLGKIHGLKETSTLGSANSNLAAGTTVENHLVSLDNAIGNRNGYTNAYNIANGEDTATSLNKLDNALGSRTYTNGYNVSDAEDVTTSIDNIDTVVGDFANVANANGNIGADVATSLDNMDAAIGDRHYASTNYVADGDDLTTAVGALDANLNRVDHDLSKLKHQFNSGMASMAAMTALVPNSRSQGNTSLSLGTGAYNGHTAMALGGFHYITDNVLLNAGAAWGNSHDVSYRLGVTWSF